MQLASLHQVLQAETQILLPLLTVISWQSSHGNLRHRRMAKHNPQQAVRSPCEFGTSGAELHIFDGQGMPRGSIHDHGSASHGRGHPFNQWQKGNDGANEIASGLSFHTCGGYCDSEGRIYQAERQWLVFGAAYRRNWCLGGSIIKFDEPGRLVVVYYVICSECMNCENISRAVCTTTLEWVHYLSL